MSAIHTAIRVVIVLALMPVAIWVIWCGMADEERKRRYEAGES
jgi:hypothetical protein